MNTHFVTYRPNSDRAKPDDLDRYDAFLSWKEDGCLEGWSARKTFRPGDLAIFYMAAPLTAIVAVGLVDSEPYYEEVDDPADYKNPVYCDFRPMWFLDNPVAVKEAVQRQGLEAWWRTCPFQSIRRIDGAVAQALIKEIVTMNPALSEKLHHLSPDDSRSPDRPVLPYTPRSAPKSRHEQWEMRHVLGLTWRQFEELVGEVFRRRSENVKVELTPQVKDYGADIIITAGLLSHTEIVQCKRYRPGVKVSCPDMQKFAGAMMKFKARKGYFVTTSTFGGYAVDFAKGLPVEMIDGKAFLQMIRQIKGFPSPAEFVKGHSR